MSSEIIEGNNKTTSSHVENLHLKQTCGKLHLNEQLADVFFVIESDDPDIKPTRIPGNKNIMAAGSEVFQSMFYGKFKEETEIKIVDATVEGFLRFQQFFYMDSVELTMETIDEVMCLADKYMVDECLNVCEQFLMKDIKLEDVCFRYGLAIGYKLRDLQKICEAKIKENPSAVFESETFLECSNGTLKHLLELDYLYCNGKEMFDACMAWGERKCVENDIDGSSMKNRRAQLGDCLYLIQFGMMNLSQLFQCITKTKGLFTSDELEEILAIISSNGQASLKRFKSKTIISQIRQNEMGSLTECERFGTCCDHLSRNHSNTIHQSEITTFRSNVKILLCAVSCIKYVQLTNSPSATMIIVQKSDDQNDVKEILVLKQKVEFTKMGQYLNLSKMIVIEPDTSYEIRIDFDSNINQSYCTHCLYPKEVKIGGDVTITFEKNASLPYDNITHGLVTSLYFKRID